MSQVKTSHIRASIAFAVGTVFFAYAFAQRVAPSVMTAELMSDFKVGGAALGALSGWYFYTYALMQLPVGMLTDRFGPRKLMAVAAFLCGLASFGMAFSDTLFSASVSRALIGGTVGFGFVGTLAIAGYFFSTSRFALLAGILQTVGMLGAIVGQAPLRLVVEQIGWRGMVNGLAIFGLVLAVLSFTLIPRRPESARQGNTLSNPFLGLKDVLRRPQSWVCAGIGFGIPSIMLGFAGLWAVPWLHTVHGLSKPHAAGLASSIFLGWALSAPLVGWLSDYIGRRKPIIMIGVAMNIVLFATVIFAEVRQVGWLLCLFILLGVSGSSMTVMFSSVRELNRVQVSSTALGLLNMFIITSGAVMQPLIGWLLDLFWQGRQIDGVPIYTANTYESAFTVLLLANGLSFLCVLLLKETRCRQVVVD